MGMGIERRARRYQNAWETHLKASKRVEEAWLNATGLNSERVAVIGAGRLLDFAADAFSEKFREVHFLDADPLATGVWKLFAREHQCAVHSHILEITGRLSIWAKALEQNIRTLEFGDAVTKLAAYGSLPSEVPNPLAIFFEKVRPSHVLSLNILSQLPVMWQNAVERIFIARYGRRITEERESEWLSAYGTSGRLLIREHLETLAASDAKHILLITDVEYFSYPLEGIDIQPERFRWSEDADDQRWSYAEEERSEAVLNLCENYDALLGVNVENERLLRVLFPNYDLSLGDTWFWQIVPRAELRGGRGTLHRVRAFTLSRKVAGEGRLRPGE